MVKRLAGIQDLGIAVGVFHLGILQGRAKDISGAAGGFCGDDVNYCGAGCQSAYGSCANTAATATQTSLNGTCGFEDGIVTICNGSAYGNCCKVPFAPLLL